MNHKKRPLKKPKLRIAVNREGYLLIFALIVLAFAAIYSGNNGLALLISLLLAFFVYGIRLSRQNIRGLHLERLLQGEFYAKQEQRIKIMVQNLSEERKYALHLYECFEQGQDIGPMIIDELASKEKLIIYYDCVFQRRGKLSFSKIKIQSRFPTNFFELRLALDCADNYIVYPHIIPWQHDAIKNDNMQPNQNARPQKVDERMRRWHAGNSMARILWKISAKRGQYVERQIIRHPRTKSYRIDILPQSAFKDEEAYEESISKAASIAVHKLNQGYSTSLWLGECLVPEGRGTAQKYKILKTLALI
ncbi:MAG: DUF58 domain-containing protein [Bradymonadia bacterium]